MKICIVGPGIMPIPPIGWGAVEILIWDYKEILEKLGHEVHIINTRDVNEILRQCNSINPDFIHVQYDEHWMVCDKFNCDNVAITSHYGYLDQENRYDWYYRNIFNGFLSLKKTRIFSLSPSIANRYIESGFDPKRVEVVPNGARMDLFRFDDNCEYEDRSIFLAKIDGRKRQYMFQNIPNLYFAGRNEDNRFRSNNFLGEWNKDYLYDNLTRYANLVLLSDGEAHPLVCVEALSAGLGLVISEFAQNNLNIDMPFIDVIPESRINDLEYIENIISDNRKKSVSMRNEIRKYFIDNFSWETIINNHYIPKINNKK